jgi:O-antigen ligase
MTLNIEYQKYIYKKTFLVVTILYTTFLSYINRLSTVVNFLLLFWGVFLFVLQYESDKKVGIKRNKFVLVIFILLSLGTILLNASQAANIKILALTVLQFFLLYEYRLNTDSYSKVKELYKLSKIYVLTTFLTTGIALCLYALRTNISILGNEIGTTHYNALYGIHTGSNTAGLVALISGVLSDICRRITLKGRYFLYINILMQIALVVLSKARSALVGLMIYYIIYMFMTVRSKRIKRLFIITALMGALVLPLASNILVSSSALSKDAELGFFSGRLLIWNQAVKVINDRFMFGVGINNVVDEVKKVATTELPGIEGGGMHNIFMQIAISNGILALIAMTIFFIYVFIKMYLWLRKVREPLTRRIVATIFAFVSALYVINLVEANLIYVANFIATAYWIYIGYGMYFVKRSSGVKDYEAC